MKVLDKQDILLCLPSDTMKFFQVDIPESGIKRTFFSSHKGRLFPFQVLDSAEV